MSRATTAPAPTSERHRERRTVPVQSLELRDQADGTVQFVGYAAVFNSPSTGLPFRERIMAGAFDESLAASPDVRLLYNHDPDTVMARTTVGDLTLSTDDVGLRVEATLNPEDLDVARAIPKLRAGHVTGMSFAFWIMDGGVEWVDLPDGSRERHLTRLDIHDGDVAMVTYPAYPAAGGGLRSAQVLAQLAESSPEEIREFLRALPADLDVATTRDALDRMAARATDLTHSDLHLRLLRALDELLGGETYDFWYWIVDVADDWLVFRARQYAGGDLPVGDGWWQVPYTVDAAGAVTLDAWVEVLPRTVYDPVVVVDPPDPTGSGDRSRTITVDQARRRQALLDHQGARA